MDELFLTATETPSDIPARGELRARTVATDAYEIGGGEGVWHVNCGAQKSMPYASKEAAFEAAVAAASNAIRDGHDVTIHVAGSERAESALGTQQQ